MNSLFKVIIAALKAKVIKYITLLRQWTSPSFLRTKVIARIRQFFRSLFQVKPKDRTDYYILGKWMVAKKLAFSIVIILGTLSAALFIFLQPELFEGDKQGDNISVYDYDNFLLRFQNGLVQIRAQDGYIAYEGQVADGACNGSGKLYREDGSLMYRGMFVNSKFEGSGQWYDPKGTLRYSGEFADNLRHGTGNSYWENGAKEYEGQWQQNVKAGQGILYNGQATKIFTGEFSGDQIVYSQMARKTTADLKELYTGKTAIYTAEKDFIVTMPEIQAMYSAKTDVSSLDETRPIESLYVLKQDFPQGNKTAKTVSELREIFGNPSFEGYTYATLGDQVAISQQPQLVGEAWVAPKLDMTSDFDDAFTVTQFEGSYQVYVYAFAQDDMLYRFYCPEPGENFYFYCIE